MLSSKTIYNYLLPVKEVEQLTLTKAVIRKAVASNKASLTEFKRQQNQKTNINQNTARHELMNPSRVMQDDKIRDKHWLMVMAFQSTDKTNFNRDIWLADRGASTHMRNNN